MFHQVSSPAGLVPPSVPMPHQHFIPQQPNWPASAIHVPQSTTSMSGFIQPGTFEPLPPGIHQFGDDDSTESESAENYYSHVNSEKHRVNLITCKRFMNMMENESGLELYPQLMQGMNDLVNDCNRLKQRSGTDKLDRIVDNLQEEIGKSDITLSQLRDQRLWRQAIGEMTKMTDSLDRLLKTSFEKYCQVREEVAAHEKAEQKRLAEDILEREQFAEDVIVEGKPASTSGAQKAAATAMRTHQQKVKSRQKKRQRHRTRGQRHPGGD